MSIDDQTDGTMADCESLAGMMLVAMPGMPDERFARSVIFLCSYDGEGAMGLIVNRQNGEVSLASVIETMDLPVTSEMQEIPVHYGGPVETGRGFILHSRDYCHEHSMMIGEDFALTATTEIMEAISQGQGPEQMIFALGYAGWSAGQLDAEIQASGWLLAPADRHVLFELDDDAKWTGALAKLGVDPVTLASSGSRA